MQTSMARPIPRPSAGPIDDIEREDDSKGYEPDSFAIAPAVLLNTVRTPASWDVAA